MNVPEPERTEFVGTFAVGAVEQPSQGKTVDRIELHVIPRTRTPDKRIIRFRASDGWEYQFARFATDEPLAPEFRTRPDGSAPKRLAQLPTNVAAVKRAIEHEDLTPPTPQDATTGTYSQLDAGVVGDRGTPVADGGTEWDDGR